MAGFREVVLDPGSDRPLPVSLWYPAQTTGPLTPVGGNRVFQPVMVQDRAVPAAGSRPLLVLSHGYGGSWRTIAWLAIALAQQGYLVAAPTHGDAGGMVSPGQRPADLVRVIAAVLADPTLAGQADPARIAGIGHSLGGWTVTALAGAKFDPRQFADDCGQYPALHACQIGIGPDRGEAATRHAHGHLRAFVTLDLGLARGFTPDSLRSIAIPSLVLAAGTADPDLPEPLESGYLARHLDPGLTRYQVIGDAGEARHSFLE